MLVNTVTLEGTLTADPQSDHVLANGNPVCLAVLEVERPRHGELYDAFTLCVLALGDYERRSLNATAKGYRLLVSGHLDSTAFPTADGSHFCQHVVVASTVAVIDDVPF